MSAINDIEGYESTEAKIQYICAHLLNQVSSDDEMRYLVRMFANTGLRIGLSTRSVENIITETIPDLLQYEKDIFGYTLRNLSETQATPSYHIPIKPMAGKAAKSPGEVLKNLNAKVDTSRLTVEYKYDGERTQLHWHGGELSMFSRNCDTQSHKFWQLKAELEAAFRGKESFIADGEVVFVDHEGKFMAF